MNPNPDDRIFRMSLEWNLFLTLSQYEILVVAPPIFGRQKDDRSSL